MTLIYERKFFMKKKILVGLLVLFCLTSILFAAPNAANVVSRYESVAKEFTNLANKVSKNPSLIESYDFQTELYDLQEKVNSVAVDAQYLDYEKVTENQVNRILEATRKIQQAEVKINTAAQKYLNQ